MVAAQTKTLAYGTSLMPNVVRGILGTFPGCNATRTSGLSNEQFACITHRVKFADILYYVLLSHSVGKRYCYFGPALCNIARKLHETLNMSPLSNLSYAARHILQ